MSIVLKLSLFVSFKLLAVRSTSDSKPSESCKDIEPEVFASDVGITKSEKAKKATFEEFDDGGLALKAGVDESGNSEIGVECSREQNLSDVHANGTGKQEEKAGHQFRIVLKSSATTDPSVLGGNDVQHNEANKEEEVCLRFAKTYTNIKLAFELFLIRSILSYLGGVSCSFNRLSSSWSRPNQFVLLDIHCPPRKGHNWSYNELLDE